MNEATRFQAARRLDNMVAETLCQTLKYCYIDVYIGPPDIITHDAGTNFIARGFQANDDLLHMNCNQVPVEAANRMSLVKCYHEY